MSEAASLSTHVIDAGGRGPRVGVEVTVEDASGERVGTAVTDGDGRIALLAEGIEPGQYTVRWSTAGSLISAVAVVFELREVRHYHLPLLVSDASVVSYLGV